MGSRQGREQNVGLGERLHMAVGPPVVQQVHLFITGRASGPQFHHLCVGTPEAAQTRHDHASAGTGEVASPSLRGVVPSRRTLPNFCVMG